MRAKTMKRKASRVITMVMFLATALVWIASAPVVRAQVALDRIDALEPDSATPGTVITIRGRSFGAAQGSKLVYIFQGVLTTRREWRMAVESWSDTRIRAVVPARIAPDDYRVEIALNESPFSGGSNAIDFRVTPHPLSISSTEPAGGPAGTVITIHGRNLGRAPGVRKFALHRRGVSDLTLRSWSDTEVRAVVPPDLAPGHYELRIYDDRSDDRSWALVGGFDVIVPVMTLSSVTPAEGLPGTDVTLIGNTFGLDVTRVPSINGGGRRRSLEIRSWSDSRIGARLPTDLTPGEYVIMVYHDNTYTQSTASVRFRVHDLPSISSVTPDAGPRGRTLVIRGRHFGARAGDKVLAFTRGVGGPPRLTILSWSDTEIRAVVPNVPPGRYGLLIYFNNGFRGSSNSVEFSVKPP